MPLERFVDDSIFTHCDGTPAIRMDGYGISIYEVSKKGKVSE